MTHPEIKRSSPSFLGWAVGMLLLLGALTALFLLLNKPMPDTEATMGAPGTEQQPVGRHAEGTMTSGQEETVEAEDAR
jgi:hypothetical protein